MLSPRRERVSEETKSLIDRLLLENFAAAGISRAVGVSQAWVDRYARTHHRAAARAAAAHAAPPASVARPEDPETAELRLRHYFAGTTVPLSVGSFGKRTGCFCSLPQ